MSEGTSTSGATAAAETAVPVAAVAAPAAAAPVDAQAVALATAAAFAAAPSVPAAPPAAPAVGPAAAAIAASEAAAVVAAAAAAKAAKAKKSDDNSDETSMSDAEVLPEVELATLGEAGAATAGQAGLPCGVLPVVDAPVAVAPPMDVPVGDAGFAFSPILLGLLGLGALGLGYLLLRNDDDDEEVPIDENDPPIAANDTATVAENATVTGNVGTNDTDPDGDDLTFALNAPVAGLTLNANGTYTFDSSNAAYGELAQGATQTVVANYTVTDEDGNTDTATLTITITGVNSAPLATDQTINVDENGAVVTGTAGGTDADGDALTVTATTLQPGVTFNPNGTFSFDPSNAAFQGLGEGETQTVVQTFTVTDPNGGTDTGTITFIVTGVNDAPVLTAPAAVTVDENIPVDTVILDADATDPDGEDVTFSISGVDSAFFAIDPLTGEVRFIASPDAEVRTSYTITVTATDVAGAEDSQDVVITVRDLPDQVNSAPVFTPEPDVTIQENVPAGTIVFDADATDPDGDPITFSLSPEDEAAFNINAQTGVVTFAISPDFETQPSYQVNVIATDDQGASTTETVTVNVGNVNEDTGPTLVLLDNEDNDNNPNTAVTFDASTDEFVFYEDDDVGSLTIITGFTSNDRLVFEEGTVVSFSTSGDDPNDLQIIVNNNGVVSEVILDNVLADNAGIIFNEATAEAQVGFDFFSQGPIPAFAADANFA